MQWYTRDTVNYCKNSFFFTLFMPWTQNNSSKSWLQSIFLKKIKTLMKDILMREQDQHYIIIETYLLFDALCITYSIAVVFRVLIDMEFMI